MGVKIVLVLVAVQVFMCCMADAAGDSYSLPCPKRGPGSRLAIKDGIGEEIYSCVDGRDCELLVDAVDGYTQLLFLPSPLKESGFYTCEAVSDGVGPLVENITYVEVNDFPQAASLSCIRGNKCSVICMKGAALSVVDNEGYEICNCEGEECETVDRDDASVTFSCPEINQQEPPGEDSRTVANDGPAIAPTTIAITTKSPPADSATAKKPALLTLTVLVTITFFLS
ncbi:uncharacterized protein [Branchiostoma lanceolatum]|uniref:uncharacterized protein isoform X3 n=1 Tax=Branchiostoma lanceolatum TaxID=7740 RepID=UPI003456C4BC